MIKKGDTVRLNLARDQMSVLRVDGFFVTCRKPDGNRRVEIYDLDDLELCNSISYGHAPSIVVEQGPPATY